MQIGENDARTEFLLTHSLSAAACWLWRLIMQLIWIHAPCTSLLFDLFAQSPGYNYPFRAIVISTALLHPAIYVQCRGNPERVNSNYIVQHLAYCPMSRAAFPRRNCTPACMCILNNIAVEKPQGSHVPIHCARETRGKQQRTHAPWQLTRSSHATLGCNCVGLFAGNEMRPGCINRSSRAAPARSLACPPQAAPRNLNLSIRGALECIRCTFASERHARVAGI